MPVHGSFVWNELATTDVERAKAFYGELLGWTFQKFPLPDGDYYLAQLDGRLVAGLSAVDIGALAGETQSYWFSFIEVHDIDARVETARQLGAEILREPVDVPTVGRVAVLRDPSGAAVGWLSVKAAPAVS